MDFTNRNAPVGAGAAPSAAAPINKKSHGSSDDKGKWYRVAVVSLIGIVVVLLIGVIVLVSTAGNSGNQEKYVDNGKLQAVFLNTGQVYFGHIKSLNNKYFVLSNIYYLQTSGNGSTAAASTSANNVSLVKLGCELHQPYDQMVINATQVTFWENLQNTGQVAKAVSTFQQQNPNGQKCSDQSSAASTTSGNSAQSAGTTTSGSTTKSGQ